MTNRAPIPRPVGITGLTGLGPAAGTLWFGWLSGIEAPDDVHLNVASEVDLAVCPALYSVRWRTWATT